ncbi:MAG: GTPase Era [Bacteroidales bacterium]|nr:GTPase Era [Bacteroidales bacterium]
MHKAGFVNIIGNPNVGKSTLMNALLGEKLSITTSKSQTTRHRIMGIFSGEDFQIVYSDTPGIVNPHYKLHQSMMNFVSSALEDADIFLLVTEVGETLKNYETLEKVISSNVPVILVINKIDISNQDFVKSKIDYWQKEIPRSIIIPTSATQGFNLDVLFNKILELLPENPPYFSKDEITDKSMRFFASEIIREKLLINYKKEVPYSSEVVIEDYKEERNIDKIFAVIYVERESQKAIIIGHQGEALKRLGTQSRIDIERFTSKKCYLDLRIKVKNNWRNDTQTLKQFGY